MTAVRVILVHLNVELSDDDPRGANEIAETILAAIEVGSDDDSVRGLTVCAPLAEEL
jgi:hypothetical protein